MRKLSFIFASLLLVVTMYAQDLKAIKLSSPDKNRGSSIMKSVIRTVTPTGEYCSQGTQFTGSIGSIMGSKRD